MGKPTILPYSDGLAVFGLALGKSKLGNEISFNQWFLEKCCQMVIRLEDTM
jgi:hypothetical protein